jgi:hypothetical protein
MVGGWYGPLLCENEKRLAGMTVPPAKKNTGVGTTRLLQKISFLIGGKNLFIWLKHTPAHHSQR